MQYVVITQSLLHDSRWVNCGEAEVGRYAMSDQRPKRDSISIEEATVSSMWEIDVIVEVLERKGLRTKQDRDLPPENYTIG